MKRKLTTILAVFCCLLLSLGSAEAQELKVGFVNTDSVMLALPQTKVQQKQLESYGKQLQARIQQKQQAFQQKYQEAVQKFQAGGMTPAEQKETEAALQQMQSDLQKEQAAAQVNMTRKETELLSPLYEKIRNAVKSVAEKNGFTYVLSESMLDFGNQAHNITQLVIQEAKGM